MGNGINSRQNEEKSLAKLAAQRQLYSDAKRYVYGNIIVSLLIPFVCSVLNFLWKNNNCLSYVSCIAAIVSLLLSMFMERRENNKKDLAAYIQLLFDVYVFDMPWDDKLFSEKKDVRVEIDKYSKQILSNPEQKKGLVNWYDRAVEMESAPELETILSCQHENYTWDNELRKRVRNGGFILSLVLIVVIIIFGIISGNNSMTVVSIIALIIPVFVWMKDLIKDLNGDMERLDNIGKRLNIESPKNMQDLQFIEYLIYDHRKQCYLIPDRIYNWFRERDSKREQNIPHL